MSNHQKRLSAPKRYPIHRKDGTYVIKAKGPHAADDGLPLVVVLRDVLEYAEGRDDAEDVLAAGDVEVNGRVQRNEHMSVGFMDILSFPRIDEHYRVLLAGDRFVLHPIDADEAGRKMVQVVDKTTLKGGVTQLNLDDGNNIETDEQYDTKSSLVVTVPDLKVETEVPFVEDNLAYVRGGKHTGMVATVEEIRERAGTHPTQVVLDDGEETVETTVDNVYMVGEDEPEVDIDADA